MMTFALHIAICTLCIVGIHEATREGMVGEKVGLISRYLFGQFLSKPLTECLTCMASVWGTAFFLMCDVSYHADPVRSWVVFVLAVAGLNATYGNVFYREAE